MRLLKFSAEWCQPCKMLAKTLEGINVPYTISSIDIDDSPNLAADYKVRGVPTMVLVDDNDKEVGRLVGVKTKAQIEEFISE
ncbi:thioredoxin family protein [bacterium]|jgi:thioredoxin 1|nr:thioredoxin family protein [bacterium]MDB4464537.1 thioredoxin family protein [bacterium]